MPLVSFVLEEIKGGEWENVICDKKIIFYLIKYIKLPMYIFLLKSVSELAKCVVSREILSGPSGTVNRRGLPSLLYVLLLGC